MIRTFAQSALEALDTVESYRFAKDEINPFSTRTGKIACAVMIAVALLFTGAVIAVSVWIGRRSEWFWGVAFFVAVALLVRFAWIRLSHWAEAQTAAREGELE